MKTFTLFILASIFFASSTNAQISKGSIVLGTNVRFSSAHLKTDANEQTTNFLSIQPSIGFSIKKNTLLGLMFLYDRYQNKMNGGTGFKSRHYEVGAFFRKYYPIGKNFIFFGEANAAYQVSKEKNEWGVNYNTELDIVRFAVYPGVSYAVSKRFLVEISMNNFLSFAHTTGENIYESGGLVSKTNITRNEFSVNTNPASNLTLGFRVILGK